MTNFEILKEISKVLLSSHGKKVLILVETICNGRYMAARYDDGMMAKTYEKLNDTGYSIPSLETTLDWGDIVQLSLTIGVVETVFGDITEALESKTLERISGDTYVTETTDIDLVRLRQVIIVVRTLYELGLLVGIYDEVKSSNKPQEQ